jgi:hypothetical protein
VKQLLASLFDCSTKVLCFPNRSISNKFRIFPSLNVSYVSLLFYPKILGKKLYFTCLPLTHLKNFRVALPISSDPSLKNISLKQGRGGKYIKSSYQEPNYLANLIKNNYRCCENLISCQGVVLHKQSGLEY